MHAPMRAVQLRGHLACYTTAGDTIPRDVNKIYQFGSTERIDSTISPIAHR
jgi:hypothetical protein